MVNSAHVLVVISDYSVFLVAVSAAGEMVNGAVRFALFAFLLVFYYHWMCDEEWSGMADEDEDSQEDLLGRLSSSLHTKSGDRVLKGDDGSYKQDSEGLHSSNNCKRTISFFSIKFICLLSFYCLQGKCCSKK